ALPRSLGERGPRFRGARGHATPPWGASLVQARPLRAGVFAGAGAGRLPAAARPRADAQGDQRELCARAARAAHAGGGRGLHPAGRDRGRSDLHGVEQQASAAVVRAIVHGPDFWAPQNIRAKVKTPLEFVVSAVRAVGGDPDTTPRLAQVVARLGQPLYRHVAPDGYPEREEAWVNSGALLDRMN